MRPEGSGLRKYKKKKGKGKINKKKKIKKKHLACSWSVVLSRMRNQSCFSLALGFLCHLPTAGFTEGEQRTHRLWSPYLRLDMPPPWLHRPLDVSITLLASFPGRSEGGTVFARGGASPIATSPLSSRSGWVP